MKIFLRKIWIFRGGGQIFYTYLSLFYTYLSYFLQKKNTGEMALKILKEYVAIRNKAKRASLSVIIALKYLLKFSELSKT